jgi:hypothetical protein
MVLDRLRGYEHKRETRGRGSSELQSDREFRANVQAPDFSRMGREADVQYWGERPRWSAALRISGLGQRFSFCRFVGWIGKERVLVVVGGARPRRGL